MAPILKPVFDILTGDVAVCDNVLYNYFILLIIGEIAFRFAYTLTGDAYRSGAIDGRTIGSILHWAIRCAIYVALAYVLRAGIWMYNFVIGIPLSVWQALLVTCSLTLATAFYLVVIKKRSVQSKKLTVCK